MRYEPARRLLQLALSLAATRTGLTLAEMAAEVGIDRRTADRMRNAVADLFPTLESWDDEARVRRWRLPGGALAGIAAPRAEAVAAVETVARELLARGETDRGGLLREAATSLRALMRPAALRRAEPDIAALMEGEGIAMRPGPRPRLEPGTLPTLRRAILGMQLVAVRYARQADEPPATRILCPYGILYGGDGRAWMVGHVEELPDMRLWRLDRMQSIELLDRYFARQEEFSLADYAARSFGVFQEEPFDVTLRILPDAAENARTWCFHPTQTISAQADGALLVQFRAGGALEMCWHLFAWGEAVQIVSPPHLRQMLSDLAASVARHHGSGLHGDDTRNTCVSAGSA